MGEIEYQNLIMLIAELEPGFVYPDYMAKELCKNIGHEAGYENILYKSIKKFYKNALNNNQEYKFFNPYISAEEIEHNLIKQYKKESKGKDSASEDLEYLLDLSVLATRSSSAILEYMLKIIVEHQANTIL